MAASTGVRRSADTAASVLMPGETVFRLTPARAATSFMVGRPRGPSSCFANDRPPRSLLVTRWPGLEYGLHVTHPYVISIDNVVNPVVHRQSRGGEGLRGDRRVVA